MLRCYIAQHLATAQEARTTHMQQSHVLGGGGDGGGLLAGLYAIF
jgi:hypothetical protein